MSLAMNIVEIATQNGLAENAGKINMVELEIGSLAGVMVEALTFCFEAATKGTLAEGAALQINDVQAKAKCTKCGTLFFIQSHFDDCPDCGNPAAEIIQGMDLKIISITVDE
ncbi:MAG: hydrogenase maturation nickel metallochaperone HypA [Proteobacteria bacterium]|nr:hydrogenase maturation nickel metallochaperone HypA [Pseudomonadota bacterium]MBU1708694.1 hydrogenase maturation nickel metallochaperone HypA [Pseudomonadota bacterium]